MARFRADSIPELWSLLHYEPDSGEFIWRRRTNSRAPAGSRAGTIAQNGYRYIGIQGRKILSARAAWLYMTGEWPRGLVDHISGDRTDDRWVNIRLATPQQNSANSRTRSHSKSGVKGIQERNGRFVSLLSAGGLQRYLGSFGSAEEAHARYMEEAEKCFGEFAFNGERK